MKEPVTEFFHITSAKTGGGETINCSMQCYQRCDHPMVDLWWNSVHECICVRHYPQPYPCLPSAHFVMWMQQSRVSILVVLYEIPFCVQISFVFCFCFRDLISFMKIELLWYQTWAKSLCVLPVPSIPTEN